MHPEMKTTATSTTSQGPDAGDIHLGLHRMCLDQGAQPVEVDASVKIQTIRVLEGEHPYKMTAGCRRQSACCPPYFERAYLNRRFFAVIIPLLNATPTKKQKNKRSAAKKTLAYRPDAMLAALDACVEAKVYQSSTNKAAFTSALEQLKTNPELKGFFQDLLHLCKSPVSHRTMCL